MRQIADYRVVQPLGGGNGGQVFVCMTPARVTGAGAQVAVKLIEQPVGAHELDVVAEELRRYAAAGGSHLVAIHDVGLWNGRLYLAMEHCPLGALAGAMGRLEERVIVRAIAGAARGVHVLHDAGIAHRNVKPSNIMLQADGGKLSDPGLLHLISPGQTVTGVGAAGAIEFMEPGVVRGERAARASDIWSFGACLHEALVGGSVYGVLPAGSLLAALRHVLGNAATVSTEVPEQWQDVIRRCIAPDRADRYGTALELAEEIDRVQGLVGA
jgi:serine/threonine protein kinase